MEPTPRGIRPAADRRMTRHKFDGESLEYEPHCVCGLPWSVADGGCTWNQPSSLRLRAFHEKVLARILSPTADFRVYPEMQFRHRCYGLTMEPWDWSGYKPKDPGTGPGIGFWVLVLVVGAVIVLALF